MQLLQICKIYHFKLQFVISDITNDGEICKTKCGKYEETYFWCWTVDGSVEQWNYCTPGKKYNIFQIQLLQYKVKTKWIL